jgi:hypothetical protein
LLKKAKWTIIVFLIATFVAGCANNPVVDNSSSQQMAAQKRKSIFEVYPSDTDIIINEALSYLNIQGGELDYNAAKAKLKMLILEHPKSTLVGSAQALILIIDNLLALQSTVKTNQRELDKANAEKAKLRKDYKYLEERYQTETVKLQQENEQLKNDLALLKKLEIQLDKREKMLK